MYDVVFSTGVSFNVRKCTNVYCQSLRFARDAAQPNILHCRVFGEIEGSSASAAGVSVWVWGVQRLSTSLSSIVLSAFVLVPSSTCFSPFCFDRCRTRCEPKR